MIPVRCAGTDHIIGIRGGHVVLDSITGEHQVLGVRAPYQDAIALFTGIDGIGYHYITLSTRISIRWIKAVKEYPKACNLTPTYLRKLYII